MIHRSITLTLCLLLALVGCAKEDPVNQQGVIELSDLFVADFELIDHFGEPASDERFEGKPMFIYFGFASCPDVCPAALSVMVASLVQLGNDAENIQPLFITIDPERDSPEILQATMPDGSGILGLTGTIDQVTHATKSMKVYTQKIEDPGSALGYTMQHQSMFFYVDAEGAAKYALLDNMAPQDIARFLKSMMAN